ncbi:MAG TPA: GH92 family glycosyl hydrolase [Chitinophagaceae bacterium]|jgi:predicted alpha-1,2-mannosidase|nr:GH92 family glycosyl hydrolase [Chitinophagaceae bacterium]
MNKANNNSLHFFKLLFCCLVCFCFIVSSYSQNKKNSGTIKNQLTKYVDPFIGTGFHGHVFLGANVPFGAVQLGPVNISQGWDWCSGYHYSDSTIIGFAHTHLSGTGIGDLGDICLMPVIGNIKLRKGIAGKPDTGYYSLFAHDQEKAKPGYYSVYLKRYGIKAELTATERVGVHQYSFPASADSKIIIDLETGIGWDSPVKTFIQKINDTTIAGYRFSKGWAADQRIFFTAIFSKPFKLFSIYEDSILQKTDSLTGRHTKGVVLFSTLENEKILVKVGISPVGIENAEKNIKAEVPNWDFEDIVQKANGAWNHELNKVKVATHDEFRLRTFYTALYHTMIAPSIFNDHNGDYLGTDKRVYRRANFTNLTTFSLWDTYRAAHPLYTIFQTGRVSDMINSMLAVYQQQGKLPVWHLMGNETNTMPGYSAVQVIVDAYLKGFKGFDTALAWEAVRTTAMQDERAIYYVKKYGFIPADSVAESVAIAMEYAIADGAIAQMAKKMNKREDYAYFTKRAMYYQTYFDPVTQFMRGKTSKGKWTEPFNPFTAIPTRDDYTEGNAWQYLWLVPQDVNGLIQLLGGEKTFTRKLDSLFIVRGDLGKDAPPDISGLIGQYAHGNEPSHHIVYLYNYVGQPWKAADKIRYILDSLYSDKPDGLSGNEDVGQMSAWYVLSALGFYQVDPAGGIYVFGSPVMDEATLAVGNGKTFHIRVINNDAKNKYIQSITFNEKKYLKSYILYKNIMAGGEITIVMGSQPSKTWGVNTENRPSSVMKDP